MHCKEAQLMSIVHGVSSVAIGAPDNQDTLHYVFLWKIKLQNIGNRVFQWSPDWSNTKAVFQSAGWWT